MNALFIGGTKDGKWIDVQALDLIRIPIQNQTILNPECEVYRIELLRTSSEEFGFYVLIGMPLEIALRRLFKYYKPDEKG